MFVPLEGAAKAASFEGHTLVLPATSNRRNPALGCAFHPDPSLPGEVENPFREITADAVAQVHAGDGLARLECLEYRFASMNREEVITRRHRTSCWHSEPRAPRSPATAQAWAHPARPAPMCGATGATV